MDLITIFQRLGLSKHSHLVYDILKKDGPQLVSTIAKLATIHRPAVYTALHDLTKKNFVSVSQIGGRRFYKATSPKNVVDEFSKVSESVAKKLAKMEPNDRLPTDASTRFLDGKNGVQEAFNDIINHTPRGETFYRYTSERDLESVNKYLPKDYRERRDAKRLERLVISNSSSGEQKHPRLERFIRYIPQKSNAFDQNIIQTIYGNRVSFTDLNSEKVIIIENKALAEFQKVIFKQLYKKLV